MTLTNSTSSSSTLPMRRAMPDGSTRRHVVALSPRELRQDKKWQALVVDGGLLSALDVSMAAVL